MACYIPRWYTRLKTVNHPGTNRARRALTWSMRRTPLTTAYATRPTCVCVWGTCIQQVRVGGGGHVTCWSAARLQLLRYSSSLSSSSSVCLPHDARTSDRRTDRRTATLLNVCAMPRLHTYTVHSTRTSQARRLNLRRARSLGAHQHDSIVSFYIMYASTYG